MSSGEPAASSQSSTLPGRLRTVPTRFDGYPHSTPHRRVGVLWWPADPIIAECGKSKVQGNGCLRRTRVRISQPASGSRHRLLPLRRGPYNPLRSSVGIPENWIVDFRGGAESKVQWNRIPLAGCRAVCSAPHSLGISDIGSLTAPADGDGGLWAAPPLLVATARLPPVGRAEVVSHPLDDIGLAIWHFGNPSNRQLLNEGTSLVRSSLRRPRMDLIAVFAYTNTAPLSPCSSTRRRAGCGTKSPTPGISILAEAEMTGGMA